MAVGITASVTGRLAPVLPAGAAYESVTDEQMERITYEDLPGDDELVTRLAPPFKEGEAQRFDEFVAKLRAWPPGQVDDPGQCVRNLLSVAAVADITADLREAAIGRIVFNELQARYRSAELRKLLVWVILSPDSGRVINQIPELGFRRKPAEAVVRERCVLYAKKYLGRMLGKLHD